MTAPIARDGTLTRIASTRVDSNNLLRRPTPTLGLYEIKLFADDGYGSDVEAGDNRFVFAIPEDLDERELNDAQAFVSTASGGGDIIMQVRSITEGYDMLTIPVRIESGEFTSFVSGAPSVVDHEYGPAPPRRKSRVRKGDLIAIDIDSAGSGAKGMGCMLRFIDPKLYYETDPPPSALVETALASSTTQTTLTRRRPSTTTITP